MSIGIFRRLQDHRLMVKLRASLLDAASRGDTTGVLVLLENGLDVNANDGGITALFMAATDGEYETLEVLLRWGADANAKDEEHSVTVLVQAAAFGDVRIVRALLGAGAEINVWDWMGRAPLDYADDGEVVDLLRRAGAEHGPEASDASDETA